MFAFNWQIALHGEPLTDEEMDQLAQSAAPVLKLRGNWTVVDPAIARKARKRLVRTVKPAQAVAATLTGVVQVDDLEQQVVVGASLLQLRERLLGAATRTPVAPPAALEATLRDYQLHGLTWLVELTRLGLGACLADDMGLGKTVTLIALHLHRVAEGAAEGRPVGSDARGLPGQPARQLGGRDQPVRARRPGPAPPRRPARPRRARRRARGRRRGAGRQPGVRAHDVRHHARRPRRPGHRALGHRRRRRGPARQERALVDRPRRCGPSRARPGWRSPALRSRTT